MANVALRTPKNADHVGLSGNVMLCEHCGARQEIALPMDVDLAVGFMKLFTAKHRRCPKREGVSAFRFATSLHDWLASDDTGISSKTIYRHMLGYPVLQPGYPHDPSDFGRCYRLLALMPAWRARMGEMAAFGKEWARLAAAWDGLTALYEAEVDVSVLPHRAKSKDGMARRLYDRMKDVINGHADQGRMEMSDLPHDPPNQAKQP